MKAMVLQRLADLKSERNPLRLLDIPDPEPGPGEIRIRVAACGVCHTELDEIEGRTPPPVLPVVPGHEIVGYVDSLGPGSARYAPGERVCVGWIHTSSGDAAENISAEFTATGRDVNGGYAEYVTAPEAYAYPVPPVFGDEEAAPLLCAGAVGYRALKLCAIRDGDVLGFTGFGGSAHIVLQMSRHLYPRSNVYVFARDPGQQRHALELGAVWAGDTFSESPRKLDAIIDTTPAWTPIVQALNNLAPGGRLVINAIRKEDADKTALMDLVYHRHLWMEREIKTVANVTRRDIEECLEIAARCRLSPTVEIYRLEDANRALLDLKTGPIKGAKVLRV